MTRFLFTPSVFNRRFGIEIEAHGVGHETLASVLRAAGINCSAESMFFFNVLSIYYFDVHFCPMELILKRTWISPKSVIGLLYLYDVDGDSLFRCFTLEDVERNEKIWGQTAIPKGRYRILKTYSPKFKREVFMLENVPNFERIYIHAGNSPDDTDGCILCGFRRYENRITRSREAVSVVYEIIQEAFDRSELVFITVS